MVGAGADLPELGADLVAALAALDVHEFTHCVVLRCCVKNGNCYSGRDVVGAGGAGSVRVCVKASSDELSVWTSSI